MLIRRDTRRDSYAVWIKDAGECPGCERDGDYTRVFVVDGWLASKTADKTKLTAREAVALLFRQYHRSR